MKTIIRLILMAIVFFMELNSVSALKLVNEDPLPSIDPSSTVETVDDTNATNDTEKSVETSMVTTDATSEPIVTLAPNDKIFDDEQTHETVVPTERPIEETQESSPTELSSQIISNATQSDSETSNIDTFIERSEKEYGMKWENIENADQIFAMIKAMDLGIAPNLELTGERVAYYDSPNFGYITQFHLDASGMVYYCIDPYTLVQYGEGYVGSQITFDRISFENLLRIAQIMSFGYGFDGRNSVDYFIATQLLIWEVLGYYITDVKLMDGTAIDVSGQKQEILDAIVELRTQPSFHGRTVKCPFNAECVVHDDNDVLSLYYEIDQSATSQNFATGYPYIDDENNLHVKYDTLYENVKQVRVKSNAGGYYAAVESMLLMTKPGSQDLLGGRLPDPIEDAEVSFESNTRNLTVDKIDEYTINALPGTTFQIAYDEKFTHLIVPNCDVGLVSEEDSLALNVSGSCSIYNTDAHAFETHKAGSYWTVGNDGALHIDELLPLDGYSTILNTQPGIYWIREVSSHQGYVVNTTAYRIDLNQGGHYTYMNLNRDVDLTIYKQDEDLDKMMLDGALWQIYEVPKPNEVRYEDGLPVGLMGSDKSGIPGEGISPLYQIDYETVVKSLGNDYHDGDLFVVNGYLYRINSIESDRIVVGVTNMDQLSSMPLTMEMIDDELSLGDTFVKDGVEYTLRMRRDGLTIVSNNEGCLFVVDDALLDYATVASWNIGELHTIGSDQYSLVEITPFQAIIDSIYRETIIIDESDPEALQKIIDSIEILDGETIEEWIGQTISYQGHEVTIESIEHDEQRRINTIKLLDTINERFTVNNDPIDRALLDQWVNQEYGYTMVKVIEPSYTFTTKSDEADANGLTIEVDVDSTNLWLSFDTVQSIYPWQTDMIRVGDTITQTYQKPYHDPVLFNELYPLVEQGNVSYTNGGIIYTFERSDRNEDGTIIALNLVDDQGNTYIVDQNYPLYGPMREYSVVFTCSDVIQPSFITSFDSADDVYFETYPYQKDALIAFTLDQQTDEAIMYIDTDTNNDGKTIDFYGYSMDRIHTHPFDWYDLSTIWTIEAGQPFTLTKQRPLQKNDVIELTYANKTWVATIKEQQQFDNVKTHVIMQDVDALDLSGYDLTSLSNGQIITIDGVDYTWMVEAINDPHYLGTLSDGSRDHEYWAVDIVQYDPITIRDMQLDANTFDILIDPSITTLTYAIVSDVLDQNDHDYGYQGTLELLTDGQVSSIQIESYSSDSIVLIDDNGNRQTLYALPQGNFLHPVYFFPLNTSVDVLDLFNLEDGQTIELDAEMIDGQYPGTIDGTIVTMNKPTAFRIKVVQNDNLVIDYDRLKDHAIDESIDIDGQTITIKNIDDEKIVYQDDNGDEWMTLKPTPLDLETINALNQQIPLVLKGIFEYNGQQYQVEAIDFNGSTIERLTYCDVESEECFINDCATPQSHFYPVAFIDCLTTADSVPTFRRQDLYPIFHGVSGGVYLRTVDINDHNRPIPFYNVTIFEDPDGLYPIATYRSDAMGVVDVSDLNDGQYWWKMPGVVMMQSFQVKHESGGLTIENLKYGQTYMACEIQPPDGYKIADGQDICHTFTVDESFGYTIGIDHVSTTFTNRKRDIDVTAYKIDQDDARQLLNGALFEVYDVTYEGKDMCDYRTCDDPYIPNIASAALIDTVLSGGIHIEESEYRLVNPIDYGTLITLVTDPTIGQSFSYDDVTYTITDVWFKDSENQHILYSDGTNEYNGSNDEAMIATNYDDVPLADVVYQFDDDPNFTDPFYAQTNAQGMIDFIPLFKDESGQINYVDGVWYYRKVDVVDQDGNCFEGDIQQYDPENIHVMMVYDTKYRLCNPGRMDLSDIEYGSKLKWCEIKSPLNYLYDPVCGIMTVEVDPAFDSVNHYRSNERIIRYRRKKRGYRIVQYQMLRLRAMADTIQVSDCALDWYRSDYLYHGVRT